MCHIQWLHYEIINVFLHRCINSIVSCWSRQEPNEAYRMLHRELCPHNGRKNSARSAVITVWVYEGILSFQWILGHWRAYRWHPKSARLKTNHLRRGMSCRYFWLKFSFFSFVCCGLFVCTYCTCKPKYKLPKRVLAISLLLSSSSQFHIPVVFVKRSLAIVVLLSQPKAKKEGEGKTNTVPTEFPHRLFGSSNNATREYKTSTDEEKRKKEASSKVR